MKTNKLLLNATRTFFLIAVIVLSSCAPRKSVILVQDKDKTGAVEFMNPKQTAYKVQPGDNLFIKVYSVDPKTSKFFQTDLPTLMNPTYLYLNSYTVNDNGFINFSFVDKMYVQGLTIEEIRALLQKTVNEYFKEATVTVKLVNFRVTVLGEVKMPGEFTIDKDQINIFQAIGLAHGIQDFGDRTNVTLIRQIEGGSEVYYIDLTDKKILESEYYYLMPNDVVYIKPLKAKSYIYGSDTKDLLFSTLTLLGVFGSLYIAMSNANLF